MKIGSVIVSVSSTALLPRERELLEHPNVGMVVLFRENWDKNAENPKEILKELIRSIRNINPNIIIAADHEGGKVWRFEQGFTKLPAAKTLGDIWDLNPEQAEKEAFERGEIMASELLDCGVDISLAPVLDLDGESNVIGKLGRAFHADPKVVVTLGEAFIRGMNQAGMPATAKHFPGHGTCRADSHIELPVDMRSEKELLQDRIPFQTLIQQGLLGAIMPAHVLYPAIDPDNVAGFSRIWLQDILRNEMNGQDLCIMSDCLSMEGANVGGALERLIAAQQAGCDFLMLTHQHGEKLEALIGALDVLSDTDTLESEQRRTNFFEKIARRNHFTDYCLSGPIESDGIKLGKAESMIAQYKNHILQESVADSETVLTEDSDIRLKREKNTV